jgi:hypothetical protein
MKKFMGTVIASAILAFVVFMELDKLKAKETKADNNDKSDALANYMELDIHIGPEGMCVKHNTGGMETILEREQYNSLTIREIKTMCLADTKMSGA